MTTNPTDPKQEPLEADPYDCTELVDRLHQVDGRELTRRIAEASRRDGAQA